MGRGLSKILTFPQVIINGSTVERTIKIYKYDRPDFELYETITSKSKRLIMSFTGRLSNQYSLEDLLLANADLDINISDYDGYFYSLMFGNSIYEKDFYLELKINGEVRFSGKAAVKTFNYNHGAKELTCRIASSINIINGAQLFDINGVPTNPLYNINPVQYQMGSYQSEGQTVYRYTKESESNNFQYPKLKKLIEDIYAYGGVTEVKFSSNLLFKGYRYLPFSPITMTDQLFENLYCAATELILTNKLGQQTLGDVLRILAMQFCSYTGMVSDETAFFKKMLYPTGYPTPFDSSINESNYDESYEYGKIEYVRVIENYNDTETNYNAPDVESFTEKENNYMNIESFFQHLNLSVDASGMKIPIIEMKDKCVSANYKPIQQAVADFWYYVRGSYEKSQVINVHSASIDYVFFENTYFKTIECQILQMELDITNGVSELKLIKRLPEIY